MQSFDVQSHAGRSRPSTTAAEAHFASGLLNSATLTFDLLISGSMHAERLPYIECTEFGVDSSSRFPFRARTHTDPHTVTDATYHPTYAVGYGTPAWINIHKYSTSSCSSSSRNLRVAAIRHAIQERHTVVSGKHS